MKKILYTFFILCFTASIGQNNEHSPIVIVKDTWQKEYFNFPLSFAPEIPLKGYEEAVFMPGWSNTESDEFWSYAFSWELNQDKLLVAKEIDTYLRLYFDGLMESVNKDKTITPPSTRVLLSPIGPHSKIKGFIGRVDIYDAFSTQRVLKLSFKVVQEYCLVKDKVIVVFKFSPKSRDHKIWERLEAISLVENRCF
ncbi:hypothetical protein [Patiriisocius hiemis]|uniref:Lipoprotein n=1 Tax=Patiriisocius hiemis TaxID=3075604 RepID=A0ABU2YCQ9_9FLAO|nr:hypothetical protein [Constantimarinum sp. W242]MDT0554833.1 hypothetical protein [Constantimarinum sp. W242]